MLSLFLFQDENLLWHLQPMLIFFRASFLVLLYSCYSLTIFLLMLSLILLMDAGCATLQLFLYSVRKWLVNFKADSLSHCVNKVIILSLFYGCQFGKCSSKLVEIVFVPDTGSSTWYSNKLHDFSFTILRCSEDVLYSQYLEFLTCCMLFFDLLI